MSRTAKILEYLVAKRRVLGIAALAFMAGLVIVDWLKEPAYSRFFWDGIGGFAAIYGFLACLVILGVAKALGYWLVYRKRDYYARYGEATDD
ncbi:MAG: hypothetical protein KGY57_04795 [Gammaproteobacteria bacterium]|nr:hypothetical protein [Gammaproteobacteria bacterium]